MTYRYIPNGRHIELNCYNARGQLVNQLLVAKAISEALAKEMVILCNRTLARNGELAAEEAA